MKSISKILAICILLLGCNRTSTTVKISQQDIEFVESLKHQDKQKHLANIDSVLNIHHKNDAKSALLY